MARGTPKPNQDIHVEMPFPISGIDETRSLLRQRPLTTVSAQNVRAFEPSTGRARGGQRPGHTKYFSTAALAVGTPIQDINHLTTSSAPAAAAGSYGQFAYALASGSGFGLGNGGTGASIATGGAQTGFAFSCSCWDTKGYVYVAETNATTGAVYLYKMYLDGTIQWGVTGLFTVAAGSIRFVSGMTIINNFLFVATLTNVEGVIHRINATNGAMDTSAWTTTTLSGVLPSGVARNCLNSIGTVLGVESRGLSNGLQGFYTFDGTAASGSHYLTYTAWGGTQSTTAFSKVVTDGAAFFYVIASVTANQLKKIGIGGVVAWSYASTDLPLGIAFDNKSNTLVGVFQVTKSVRQFSLTGGTVLSSVDAGGVTAWFDVDCDNQSTFVLWRNSVASNDVMALNASLATVWGPVTLANTSHTGASVNKGNGGPAASVLSTRVVTGVLVSGGTAKTFTSSGVTAITNGTVFAAKAPVIFSAENGQNLFFVDGVVYYYYKGSNGVMTPWTLGSGRLPVDSAGRAARLICTWRSRTVLAGLLGDPQNFFMSAVGNAFDFNYSPATSATTQAVAGNASPAGLLGEPIQCLLPYTDDTLVFGLSHSIWQLTGDPMAGGTFDLLTDEIGMPFGRPYVKDPLGQLYFMSSRAGIYKLTPGALPVRVSQQIEKRIENIDLSANIIRMIWDWRQQGLGIYITPINGGATTHFFFEERTQAWQMDVFTNPAHSPFAVHMFDGDNPNDRQLLIGGQDGYVRSIDINATSDDGYAIASSVVLGPLTSKQLDDLLFKDLQATLTTASGTVTWQAYLGETPDGALASTPVAFGTWTAGRNSVEYIRLSGFVIYVKLSATTPWAFEKLMATYTPLGRVRQRASPAR